MMFDVSLKTFLYCSVYVFAKDYPNPWTLKTFLFNLTTSTHFYDESTLNLIQFQAQFRQFHKRNDISLAFVLKIQKTQMISKQMTSKIASIDFRI